MYLISSKPLFNDIYQVELQEVYSKTIIDPITLLYLGLGILIASGTYFAILMRNKLLSWEKNKTSPLPLENPKTILSWSTAFTGLTLIFIASLRIFDFSIISSLSGGLVFTLTSGIIMWKVIKDLLKQVENDTIKEIDDYL